jgi:hypothetical protein
MDPKTVQRRRSLFWELFSTELFYVRPFVLQHEMGSLSR